jgi:arginyl-tRNA synthetase
MKLIAEQLAEVVAAAVHAAQAAEQLPALPLPAVVIERPKRKEQGDWATALPLQMVRPVNEARASQDAGKLTPLQIAQIIAAHLREMAHPALADVSALAPGFINFYLAHNWLTGQVDEIRSRGEAWAALTEGENRRIQVEFVSANPTGPLHFGGARNAVFGDTLARVMTAVGYDVQREFYVNDAGSQMRKFGASLLARYAQALGINRSVPEDGYHGAYLAEWGAQLAATHDRHYLDLPEEQAISELTDLALQMALEGLRTAMERLDVRFDRWFSERSLFRDGTYETALALLEAKGLVYHKDGATWFAASRFPGADKDEVLVRRSGEPTYLASDIAYHYDKFVRRGFERVINVWSMDHQGHVPRMNAVVAALGLDPARLTIPIYALVKLKRGGEEVKLSKRAGDIVTLTEVVDEVGADAVRFMLLTRAAESEMEFDLKLAAEQSSENPVYYVQYAHARICSILRRAQEMYTSLDEAADVTLLHHPSEMALLRKMLELPEIIAVAARHLAPHHLTYYAQELANAFHLFYRDCRVISSDPADAALSQARLKLVDACRIMLARTLHLMGMSAPEQM